MVKSDAEMMRSEDDKSSVKSAKNVIHITRKKTKKRKKKRSDGTSSVSESESELINTVIALKKAYEELLARHEKLMKICEEKGVTLNEKDDAEIDDEMVLSEDVCDNEVQSSIETVQTADKYKNVISNNEKGKPNATTKKADIASDRSVGKNKIDENNPEIKEAKPAPIYIREKTSKELVNVILQTVGEGNFHTVLANSTPPETKVQVYNVKGYRSLTSELEKRKIEYYTYQLKDEKGLSVVIKGIEPEVDVKEIEEELINKGYKVKHVHNIINRGKIPQPLHLVELEPDIRKSKKGEVHDIYNEKYILHRKINIEEPRRRTGPIQCHNCQEFGHTKAYCRLSTVCVICGDNHHAMNCKKDRNDPTGKFCKNCGENHTANYRGCKVYAHLKGRIQNNKRATQNTVPIVTVTPGVSYASTVKGTPQITENNENVNSTMLSVMLEIMREVKEQSRLFLQYLSNKNE